MKILSISIIFISYFILFFSANAASYYINNSTYNADDIYTTAVGNNANNGTSPSTPKATFANLWSTYGPSGTNVITTGDVIYIDAGTYTSSSATAPNCWCNFNINKSITIQGVSANKTIIDNNNVGTSGSYYFADLTASVTINDIQFIHYSNFAAGNGQVFNISGTGAPGVSLNDVITDDNGGTGGFAAIKITGASTVSIDGGGQLCDGVSYSYAGGIDVVGSGSTISLTVTNHIFSGNSRDNDYGGALKISGTGTITVNVSNSIFTGNSTTSDSYSGASIFASSGTLNVTDCIIENSLTYNNSSKKGSACYFTGGTQNFTRVLVRNNVNGTSTAGTSTYGTIAVSGGALTLSSCYFSGNSSKRGNDVYSTSGSISASNTTFASSATGYNVYKNGGTITLVNSGNPTNTGGVTFTNTTAPSAFTTPTTPSFSGDCGSGIVLPLVLLDCRIYKKANDAVLDWRTSNEVDLEGYEILKSIDGTNWERIGFQIANGSEKINQYKFVDSNFSEEIEYYKIIGNDQNGYKMEFPILSLKKDNNTEVEYYNLLGQKVDVNSKGILLKKHKDGYPIQKCFQE